MKTAVIGLGSMGMGVARTLLAAGHDVWGCDPRAEARAAFAGSGAARAADLPRGLDAVVLLVVNAKQSQDVLFGPEGCAANLAPGTVVMSSATMAASDAIALEARLGDAGLLMLDAPVSGGPVAAAEGRLSVMASGAPEAFVKAAPVLDAIAGKLWRLGDRAGPGSTTKMVNQLLAGVHIAAAAEAMALGIRAGADPQALFEVISASAGSSWMWQNRVPHVLAGDDTPHSAVNIFVKDLGIVLDAARAMTFPLPLASAAHQLFLAAAAGGDGPRDDAFVIRVWERLARIALPDKPGADGRDD